MAGCDKFVSLLRSCYSTQARFFRDGLEVVQDIEWYFTDPKAKWIGVPNVFNARTWYDGTPDWPALGEVEGAPRKWRSEKQTCLGLNGPQGTADQWENGAYRADALAHSPCFAAIALPFPQFGASVFYPDHIQLMEFPNEDFGRFPDSFDIVVGDSAVPVWLCSQRVPAPPGACCFPSRGLWALSSSPDLFEPIVLWSTGGVGVECQFVELFDPDHFPFFFARIDCGLPPGS